MMRLILFLMIFSLAACGGVTRPDAPICVANAPAKHSKCYNLKDDYRDDGTRKGDAKPFYYKLETIYDINKMVFTTPEGFGEIKKSLAATRRHIEGLQKDLARCRNGR